MRRFLALTALLAVAAPAYAEAAQPGWVWTAWFDDAPIEIAMAMVVAGYLFGLARIRVGADRAGEAAGAHVAAFFAGVTITVLALLSPLDAVGGRLFSVHMFQHLLLIIGAAPLFALSGAHVVLAESIPEPLRRRLGTMPAMEAIARWWQRPSAAWAAGAALIVTIWFWHVPVAHDWAIDDALAHAAEHLTVLAAATIFWRVVLTSGRRRISPGAAALMVSLVGLSGALLSALIMFSPQPLCRAYINNPIEDQVLAGLLMCIPASFVYLGSTIWALWRLIGGEQSHAG